MRQQLDWQQKLKSQPENLHVHLMGIGGTGLSAIAQVLLEQGVEISGSDRQSNANTEHLVQQGATIFCQQIEANLTEQGMSFRPDVVLISSAIDSSNPELQAAEWLELPVVKRDDFLPILLSQRQLIAVAGTHGKSTTTAMIIQTLWEAGIEAGYIVGTIVPGYGNASAGNSPYFVLEADEYDHMFLGLHPTVAIITNVEWDHPDCYPTAESFMDAFKQFVQQVQPHGTIISCADDAGARQLQSLSRIHCQNQEINWITYGYSSVAHMQAVGPAPVVGSGYQAGIAWQNEQLGRLTLRVPGLHNLQNALAALAIARWCQVPSQQALAALASFAGTARRFEYKGVINDILIFDDYAHHPSEIRATLSAARKRYPDRRIWAIFQPHTYSRTREMLGEMAHSFIDADQVLVTDIYSAREIDDGTVKASNLVMASPHSAILHTPKLSDAVQHLKSHTAPNDVVITLGAIMESLRKNDYEF